MATAPGWYYAAGDPPGTQRYWSGSEWVGAPQPDSVTQPPQTANPTSAPWTAPAPAAPSPAPGAFQLIVTPNIVLWGNYVSVYGQQHPLTGCQWFVSNASTTTKTRPTWAIVCAIIFSLACLLGLLFLLVSEDQTTGTMTVTVRTPDGGTWSEVIPIHSEAERNAALYRVNMAQSATANAV